MEIFDCNALFGFWPKRKLAADIDSVRELARDHGITGMMLASIRGIFDDFELGNEETYEICRNEPNLIPVMTLNPCRYLGVEAEIGKWRERGLRIFRFFPDFQNWPYSYAPFQRILRHLASQNTAESQSLIILPARVGGHGKHGVISEIGLIAGVYPKLRFLITGAYYGNLAEAIVAAQDHPNLMLETHLVNSPEGIRVLVEHVGADRVVFGTEMPLNYPGAALGAVTGADLTEECRTAILAGNARRILEVIP